MLQTTAVHVAMHKCVDMNKRADEQKVYMLCRLRTANTRTPAWLLPCSYLLCMCQEALPPVEATVVDKRDASVESKQS